MNTPSHACTVLEDDLVRSHHELCSEILREEEDIVEAHRTQIDQIMKLVKEVN
jgi:hypothetical protein